MILQGWSLTEENALRMHMTEKVYLLHFLSGQRSLTKLWMPSEGYGSRRMLLFLYHGRGAQCQGPLLGVKT